MGPFPGWRTKIPYAKGQLSLHAATREKVLFVIFYTLFTRSEVLVAQSCPTLGDPVDCSPPVSSVHGIFQARVLEWGAMLNFQYLFCSPLCCSYSVSEYSLVLETPVCAVHSSLSFPSRFQLLQLF